MMPAKPYPAGTCGVKLPERPATFQRTGEAGEGTCARQRREERAALREARVIEQHAAGAEDVELEPARRAKEETHATSAATRAEGQPHVRPRAFDETPAGAWPPGRRIDWGK